MRAKESRLKFALATLITMSTFVFSAGVIADDSTDTQAENEVCRDNHVLSTKLFTDVCWACIFPIKVAGATLGPSGEVPDDAATGMVCACADGLGV
ncbi:TraU family protein, partial [Klebsiella pneumoniae]